MPNIFANKMRIDNEAMDMTIQPPASNALTDSFNRTNSMMTMAPTANDATSQPGTKVVGDPYKLESDPVYQSAISAGQSQFNLGRANALANKTTQEMELGNQRKALDTNSAEARRRTAGNYAARGMAGGAAGAGDVPRVGIG